MGVRIGIVIITWLVAFLVFRNSKSSSFSRWASLVIFIAGNTTFLTCIQLYLLPYLRLNHAHWTIVILFLHFILAMFTYICIYGFPYAVLMSCIVFCGIVPQRWIRVLIFILLLPIIPLSLSDQVHIYPIITYDFQLINIYTSIYVGLGCFLMILSIFQNENNEELKRSRNITFLFYVPMFCWITFSNYLNVKSFSLNDLSFDIETNFLDINQVRNVFYTICYILILYYVYFATKHGLFGIKLSIERQKLDHTRKALLVGANFLNHTIKNEIQKLNYLGSRTKDYIAENNQESALSTIDSMFLITEHMSHMVGRIREKSDEIVIRESIESLTDMIQTTLTALAPAFLQKRFTLITRFDCEADVFCDRVHLCEVISNLILNAYDAIPPDTGILEIHLFQKKNSVIFEFSDNGCGIAAENLSKVFDPFFTTKNNPSSYGLGLSYCYAVMQKHHGLLKIVSSEVNRGTSIALKLPISKVVKMAENKNLHSTRTVLGPQ